MSNENADRSPSGDTPVEPQREVWTKAERQVLERAIKLLSSRGILLTMTCPEARCADHPWLTRVNMGAHFELRCAHKHRIFSDL